MTHIDWFMPGPAGRRRIIDATDTETALAALLADPGAARLYHRGRPLLPAGGVDHELIVVVAPDRHTGALRYDRTRTWFTRGDPPPVGTAPLGAVYDFPAASEVPIDVLTAALTEFLGTARRPRCVEWQESP